MPNVLIVAGGVGARFGSDTPKQYHNLNGKQIIEHTIDAFLIHPKIQEIFIVVSQDDEYINSTRFINNQRIIILRCAGNLRKDSVRNGLNEISKIRKNYNDIILIHDACRPFISIEIIDEIINNTKSGYGTAPGINIIDAVKRINSKEIIEDEDRNSLVRIQTPQAFIFSEIRDAHNEYANENADDDIQVYLKTKKGKAIWVKGDEKNIKITTRKDMEEDEEYRIGSGFDVHKFTDTKTSIMLGGHKIDCGFGVEAHSDGDVILHALADAMLGALGEADIGLHFPGIEKYKNADSKIFIYDILEIAKKKGAKIINTDITVISETPKISLHRNEIRSSVANSLGVSESRVNIKATTTEKLGFLGRKEGIAAEAVVLLKIKNQEI